MQVRIRQLSGRLSNGAARDHGKCWHAIPAEGYNELGSKALCGAKPGRTSGNGWGGDTKDGEYVTCSKCFSHLTIAVGQRVFRWDGEPGFVSMNSLGKRAYDSNDEFQVEWKDGEVDHYTLATLETEGVRRGKGRMPWAR